MHVSVPNQEKLHKKVVFYEGTDTLYEGYNLCYNSDYGSSDAAVNIGRAARLEKPSSTNVHAYAGVVAPESDGVVGPNKITIIEPTGSQCSIHTDANCTIDATELFLKPDSYAAGDTGSARIGLAAQTLDRSSTAGIVQARLAAPSAPRATDQECNSSTTFTGAIWDNFPLAELRKYPHLGTFLEYDPVFRPEQQIPERAEYTGGHNSVTDTHVASTTLAAIEHNLVLSQDSSATDNDAVAVQFPGPVTISGGKEWAFEVDYDLTTVTDADMESFVGLLEASTLGNAIPYQDAGAYATASDLIGFEIKVDDGNGLDVVYKAGADTVVTHQASAGAPVANTAITVGMYYNGTTIQPYINGTATTVISAADIADVTTDTFPAAIVAYLTMALKGDSGVQDGDDMNIRAFRVAQLA